MFDWEILNSQQQPLQPDDGDDGKVRNDTAMAETRDIATAQTVQTAQHGYQTRGVTKG